MEAIIQRINEIGGEMYYRYLDNVKDGMTTAEDYFELGDYTVNIECYSYGNSVEIRDINDNVVNNVPNIEQAILNVLPTYDQICEDIKEARDDAEDMEAMYTSLERQFFCY